MDDFFTKIILLGEESLTGIYLLTFVIGGLIASQILTVHVSIRRVTYVWWIASLNLALMVSQLGWATAPAAADAGLFSALCILMISINVIFGVGLYYASAGRSNDIDGNVSRAWLGFVPIANLWLIFGGRKKAIYNESPRPIWARWLLDPALIIGAVFIFGLAQIIGNVIERAPLYDVADSEVLRDLITKNQTLEESFAAEAISSGAVLPIQVDEITTFSDISADGDLLRLRFDVSEQILGMRPDFINTLAKQYCAEDMFATDIARGGTIAIDYFGPDEQIIQSYEITSNECLN